MPSWAAFSLDMRIAAEAPSSYRNAWAAVTTPAFFKHGGKFGHGLRAGVSDGVLIGREELCFFFTLISIGRTSRLKIPSSVAFTARLWLRMASSSHSCRVIPVFRRRSRPSYRCGPARAHPRARRAACGPRFPRPDPVAETGLGNQIRGIRHAFHAHDKRDICFPQHDAVAGNLFHGAHPGGTVLVHVDGRTAEGKAGPASDTCLAGSDPHPRENLAHDDLIDHITGNAGPRNGLFCNGDGQVSCGNILQTSTKIPNGWTDSH